MSELEYREQAYKNHVDFLEGSYAFKEITHNLSDANKERLMNLLSLTFVSGFNVGQGYETHKKNKQQ